MNLRNLTIAGMSGDSTDLRVENEKIVADGGSAQADAADGSGAVEISLSLPGAIVFPGLINSHDHLDFNLFPALGKGGYPNYGVWGRDIHLRNAAEIAAVLKVPLALRTKWGIYKNMLAGVTTVVNHGERLFIDKEDALITIVQNTRSLHSVGFEKNWKWKINLPHGSSPVVIHVGEGTDAAASREINSLIKWNLFRKSLVGIHGVAMDEQQARGFTALVWCPVSNYFLLDGTARIGLLKKSLPILFGTDSTLTGGWNIWDHMRLARKEGALTDKELLDTLTVTPARVWGLEEVGSLTTGQFADLVIARPRINDRRQNIDLQDRDAFYSLDPEDLLLVMHHGRIRLFDATLFDTLASAGFGMESYKPITFNDRRKYVYGDLPGLVKKIREYYPAAAFPFTID